MTSTHYLGYAPMTDTSEIPLGLIGLRQFLPRSTAYEVPRHRAARKARKAARALFTTLVAVGVLTLVAVTVWGPAVVLDVADALAR